MRLGLKDQACMISCLLSAFEIANEKRFLQAAEELSAAMMGELWDNKGGFFDRPHDSGDVGELAMRIKPIAENSLAADNFIRLHNLTGNEKHLNTAKSILSAFSESYGSQGQLSATYAISIERLLFPVKIEIAGGKDKLSKSLFESALKTFPPIRTVRFLDIERDVLRIKEAGYEWGKPASYICSGNACSRPVTRPGDIEMEVKSMLKAKPN